MNRHGMLHFAAHATYDAIRPGFSRIALAPDDANDGHLEVHEIIERLDLSGVNLVVLSACRTAQLEIMEQEDWRSPYYWAAFTLNGERRGRW